jgi:hypothetical protein
MELLDSLGSFNGSSRIAHWANRFLLVGLCLFALSLPHSIAAAHITLDLSLLSWIVRDLANRRLRISRTPFDLPLLCFVGLTVLSTIFSEEPRLSARKLLSLLLFGLIYIVASNVSRSGVRVMVALLIISSLAGAGFSIIEKVVGRGMTVSGIEPGGPLATSELRTGDVIWMISRRRVSSLEDVHREIARQPAGKVIEIEAIHEGDPLLVKLPVTESMLDSRNPLGIEVSGASRRFRASGFSRHFLTFAEQMQIMALAVFGFLIAASSTRGRVLLAIVVGIFAMALVLTASRAVLASFLIALVVAAALSRRSRAVIMSMAVATIIALISVGVLVSTRNLNVARLVDDSSSRRVAYMRAGLRLIPQHPLLGVGMDSHKEHWKEWGFPGDYVTHTHSSPIQIALDRGIPALMVLTWFFVSIAMWLVRKKKEAAASSDRFGEGLTLGSFAALTGFLISSLVNYNFGDSEVLLMMLFLVSFSLAWFGEKQSRDTN